MSPRSASRGPAAGQVSKQLSQGSAPGKRTADSSKLARNKNTSWTEGSSAARMSQELESEVSVACTKIQSNWRRLAASRHVFLMKLVVHEIRNAMEWRRKKKDSEHLKATAKERFRELCHDVMFAVKKCIQAYKATQYMKHDRVQRERVARLRARRLEAQTAVLRLRNNIYDCQVPAEGEALEELEERERFMAWLDGLGHEEAYEADRAARKIQAAWFRRDMRGLMRQELRWWRLQRAGTGGQSSARGSLQTGAPPGPRSSAPLLPQELALAPVLEELSAQGLAHGELLPRAAWATVLNYLPTGCCLASSCSALSRVIAGCRSLHEVPALATQPGVLWPVEEEPGLELSEAAEAPMPSLEHMQSMRSCLQKRLRRLESLEVAEAASRRPANHLAKSVVSVFCAVLDAVKVPRMRQEETKDDLTSAMKEQAPGRSEEGIEAEFAKATETQVPARREEVNEDELAISIEKVPDRREEETKDELVDDLVEEQAATSSTSRPKVQGSKSLVLGPASMRVSTRTSASGPSTRATVSNTQDAVEAASRRRPAPLAPLLRKSSVPAEGHVAKEGSLEEAAEAPQPPNDAFDERKQSSTGHFNSEVLEEPFEAPVEAASAEAPAGGERLPSLLQRRGPLRPADARRPRQTARRPRQIGGSGGLLTRICVPTTPRSPASPSSPTPGGSPPVSPSTSPVVPVTPTESSRPRTGAGEAPEADHSRPLGLLLGVAAAGVGAGGVDAGDWQLVVLGVGPGPVRDHAMRMGLAPRLRRGDRLLSVNGAQDLGEMLVRLADPQGAPVELEVELRTAKEAAEAAEAAVVIGPGDRLLGPASTGAAGGAEGPGLFSGLERAATLALLPEWRPGAGGPEGPEAEPFSPVPSWERRRVAAAQRPRGASGAGAPRWLAESPCAPLLRDTICDLGAGDALELLFKLDSSTGWSARSEAHATVRRELHAATCAGGDHGLGGGAGLWAALEAGVAGGAARGSSEVLLPMLDPRLWCEALFHFAVLAMQRERDRLAELQDDWTLGSVRGGWGRRLEGLEEALGWCAQSLDVLQAVRELTGPVTDSVATSTPVDMIPPVKPAARHAVLEREAARASRELAALRRREAEAAAEAKALASQMTPVPKRGLEWVQAAKARRVEAETRQREERAGPLSFEAWKESSQGRRAGAGAALREPECARLPPGAFPVPPPLPPGPRRREATGPGGTVAPRSRRFCAMVPARGIVVA